MAPPCYNLPVLFFPSYLFYLFCNTSSRSYRELSTQWAEHLRKLALFGDGKNAKDSQSALGQRIISIAEMSSFCLVQQLIIFLDHLYEKRPPVGS